MTNERKLEIQQLVNQYLIDWNNWLEMQDLIDLNRILPRDVEPKPIDFKDQPKMWWYYDLTRQEQLYALEFSIEFKMHVEPHTYDYRME